MFLVVHSLDPAAGSGTQRIDVNSGGTYTDSTTGIGVVASGGPSEVQIGATDFAGPNYTGDLRALFIWNRKLNSTEDGVVRAFFKRWYAIQNW